MNCTECKEILVGYVEQLLDESQKQALQSHLHRCPACRAEADQLIGLRDRLVTNGKTLAQIDLENNVLNQILREQNLKLRQTQKHINQFQLWRKIMKSPITKLAAAAVIIIAVVLSITFLDKSVSPAYAIEQTIQASHTVRYLHIKSFKANEDEPKEFWVEFYEDGGVKNVRMHMPEWDSPEDGAKVTVWKENKAQVWFKKKKSLVTIRDKTVAAHILNFIEELDPKLVVERLYYARQAQGIVEIEIDEPSNKAEPILVTATCLPGSPRAGWRLVLFVDRATKLVTDIEFYRLKDGKYQYVERIEYYDYNQPIETKMFSLDDDDIPADVMRIDQTTQKIGLVQGNLTDKEIAVKVVREFYEALIEQDYAKAGRLFGGVPAEKIERAYGDTRFIRIISIGEPTKVVSMKALKVPCKIEIEEDGQVTIWEPEHSYVRQVHGQPERWEIIGGFRGI